MVIDNFDVIISMITLAKELHDMGRYDIVTQNFHDVLDCDNYHESMYGMIENIFDEYYIRYNEYSEEDLMIFMDDILSNYYINVWEYGQRHNIPHEKNPYVISAQEEISRWLNFSYSLDWNMYGYTKTKKTARQSKLIVCVCACEFCEYEHLAYGLLMIHKWFTEQLEELKKINAMDRNQITLFDDESSNKKKYSSEELKAA